MALQIWLARAVGVTAAVACATGVAPESRAPAARAAAVQADSARAALKAVLDNLRGGGMAGVVTLSVYRGDAVTRYRLEVVSDGQERALLRVTQPPREAGQAFLRDGDNLWIYVPRLRRSLRLPPSGRADRFLGSDLSYSDLSGRDAESDYDPQILAESEAEVTLRLVPRPGAPTPYGEVHLQASRPYHAPLLMLFFDQRGQAVRRITFQAYVEADGYRVPTRVTVQDLLREGHLTVMEYERYRFGISPPAACFTLQALEGGCPVPLGSKPGGGRPA